MKVPRVAVHAFTTALLAAMAAEPQDVGVPVRPPAPGPVTDGPYAPQPILPGGVVVTLFPPDSP